MSDRGAFVASRTFCQLHSSSEFLKNNYGGRDAWKLAKDNGLTYIFLGFESPGNPMKWLEFSLLVLR